MVFVGVHPRLAVIASQCAHWRGNPPVERNHVTITTKNHGELHNSWRFSVHFPSNRGIATTSVRTGLAMTALFFKHQFPLPAALARSEPRNITPDKIVLEFSKKVCYNTLTVQGSYIGNTTASQAVKAGSTPVPCSIQKPASFRMLVFLFAKSRTHGISR